MKKSESLRLEIELLVHKKIVFHVSFPSKNKGIS
jgi:hypothetical protein